jgi:starch-binding outer membrane protein, SusD/RagB family
MSEIPDQASFSRRIMIERQREFPYEGHRWYDLVRMGFAREVMAVIGHHYPITNFYIQFPKLNWNELTIQIYCGKIPAITNY